MEGGPQRPRWRRGEEKEEGKKNKEMNNKFILMMWPSSYHVHATFTERWKEECEDMQKLTFYLCIVFMMLREPADTMQSKVCLVETFTESWEINQIYCLSL